MSHENLVGFPMIFSSIHILFKILIKRSMKKMLPLVGLIFLLISCQKDDQDTENVLSAVDSQLLSALNIASNGEGVDFFKFPASDDLDKIPQDPQNPLTTAKVKLGQLLYHESALGIAPSQEIGAGTYSCASCHFASAGFQACRVQGIGEGGTGFGVNGEGRGRNAEYEEVDLDVQPIRSPTAMNGAYQKLMLWNGQFGATGDNVGTEAQWTVDTPKETNNLGYEGLETQAIAGLKVHRMDIDMDVLEPLGYKEMFDLAFGDFPVENRYSRETAGLAIAAYERTIFASEAPFQRWLEGEYGAMDEKAKRGALVFFEKGNCASCHTGPALNSESFHALGMKDLNDIVEVTFKTEPELGEDFGRGGFTKRDEDMYKFKTPQLYNLADSPFMGHGSSFRSIEAVLAYKNTGVAENSDVPANALSNQFQPLGLTDEELEDLAAFIEFGLRDPYLNRYEPDAVLSGSCFPFNDEVAKQHLGCN